MRDETPSEDKILVPMTRNQYEEFNKWDDFKDQTPVATIEIYNTSKGYREIKWMHLYKQDEVLKEMQDQVLEDRKNRDSANAQYRDLLNRIDGKVPPDAKLLFRIEELSREIEKLKNRNKPRSLYNKIVAAVNFKF